MNSRGLKWFYVAVLIGFPLILGGDCGGPAPQDFCATNLCDDGEECTSDVCANQQCSNPSVANGTSCDGGSGSCLNGTCEPADPACIGKDCSDGDECTSDVCTSGTCSNPPVANGTSCAGGTGACQSGVCQANDPCAGKNCNDSNECTEDGCANGICSNTAYREGQSCAGGDGECANGICQLDHVLRIINDLNSLNVNGEKNAVVRVRIGRYSSDCSYVVKDASTERLNPRDSWPASSVGNTDRISPGSREDFDLSGIASGGRYCLYVQAGWWDYIFYPSTGFSYWQLTPTYITACDRQTYIAKESWGTVTEHYSGVDEFRVSQWLPHGITWAGSWACP